MQPLPDHIYQAMSGFHKSTLFRPLEQQQHCFSLIHDPAVGLYKLNVFMQSMLEVSCSLIKVKNNIKYLFHANKAQFWAQVYETGEDNSLWAAALQGNLLYIPI